jgi:ribosomal protein S18 acetylase RimI-like enzyme
MIEASTLQASELPDLAELWTKTLAFQGSNCTLSPAELEEHILLHGGEPRAILAVDPRGWIVARNDDGLQGFIHCTVGRLPDDDPETLRGFVRTVMVAPAAPAGVTRILLRAADSYFRSKKNLDGILAFHIYAGYPYLNDGRGPLLYERWDLMDALGVAGYQLTRRWLFYEQIFETMVPEQMPLLPGLRLRWDEMTEGELALSVWLDLDQIATARFLLLPRPGDCHLPRTASLYHLEVAPDARHQGVGRWLLARAVNHLVTTGIRRMLVDAPHEDALLQSRLRRLGYDEQPQRGYTYEKSHV